MRIATLSVLLTLALVAVAPQGYAAGATKKGSATAAAYYRYRNAQGVLVMESSIPPEYVGNGYQILNSFMQVIETVPPAAAITDEDRRAKVQDDSVSSRKDGELRKLYSAPQDAERLRDRQLDALGLKIEHARGQLNQTVEKRKKEVEQAAKMERAGTKVPVPLRESIDRLTRQMNDQAQQIKVLEGEVARVRAEFEPIIGRLRIIYPDKAGPLPAVSPAVPVTQAAPVAAAPPAVVAKVPVAPVAAPAVVPAKITAPPVAKTAAALTPPPPAPVPMAAPAKPPLLPVSTVAKPAPAPAVPAKPAPAVIAPAKPVAAPAKTPPPTVVAPAPAKPAGPQAPPVVPVKSAVAKPAGEKTKAATDAEKAAAKSAAKAQFELEDEPRSAGGLRPTGVR